MLNSRSADHDDLRTGTGPWCASATRPRGRQLTENLRCDVAIVGGGITGALLAEHLTAIELDVVLIDREQEGLGSTAASTAMLQWEIDLSLRDLSALYGFELAAQIYRLSAKSVAGLAALVRSHALPCRFAPRRSIYLSAGEAGPRELRDEAELRGRAGLPGDFVEQRALLDSFGFNRPAAIVSPGSAEADPLRLCHALIEVASRRGARLIRDEALAFDGTARSAGVRLASGHVIEAAHVVLATGYVMPEIVPANLHRISSSWAIATVPQSAPVLWPGRALVWEASEDYCYCRTTAENRIVFGGEDEAFSDPERRETLGPRKRQALLDRLHALIPQASLELDFFWSGAFGETEDGLPLIGRVPGHPRLLAAYGYGGNGISFSFLASRVVGDLVRDREQRWFRAFAIDRTSPN